MTEILSVLKLKEKVSIISSMSALAIMLVVLSALLSLSGVEHQNHIYEYQLDKVGGDIVLSGHCTVDGCSDPSYREVNPADLVIKESVIPTCSKEGKRVYVCSRDGSTATYTEHLDAVHNYQYSINTVEGVMMLTAVCTEPGCPNAMLFISGFSDFKLESATDASCFMPRLEVYSYVKGGEKLSFATLVGDANEHILGGTSAGELTDDNGLFIYGTEGIEVLTEQPLRCGDITDGYYQCDHCGSIITVSVKKPGHTLVNTEDGITNPTLESQGKAVLLCTNDGCGETVTITLPPVRTTQNASVYSEATELSPQILLYQHYSDKYQHTVELYLEYGEPLSHKYSYELVLNGDGSCDFVGTCSQAECQTPVIKDEDVKVTIKEIVSSCPGNDGGFVYTYITGGKTYTTTKVNPGNLSKHSFDYDESTLVLPTPYEDGSVVVGCSTADCEWSEKLVLPMVEFGKNAEILLENPNGTVDIKYNFSTDYGFNLPLSFNVVAPHDHTFEKILVESGVRGYLTAIKRCTVKHCGFSILVEDSIDMTNLLLETKSATCTDWGAERYTYISSTLESFTMIKQTTPPSHKFKYDLAPVDAEYSAFNLVITCSRCDHSSVEQGVTVEMRDTSTCLTKGEWIWTYNDGTRYATYRIESPALKEHDYGHKLETEDYVVFDLVSVCLNCESKAIEYDVAVESFNDSTCSTLGKIYWIYNDYNGKYAALDKDSTEYGEHDFKKYLEFVDGMIGGPINFVTACQNEGCDDITVVENVECVFTDTSTCMQEGVWTWTYDNDGEPIEMSMTSPERGDHSFNSESEWEIVTDPSLSIGGEVRIHCTTEGCDRKETIRLPIIDFETNSKLGVEGDEYYLVKYTYTIEEYGITIVREIPVEKHLIDIGE